MDEDEVKELTIDEVWEQIPCKTCRGERHNHLGMICNTCGGFGFTMKLMSQSTLVNGELTEVWPDE